MCSPELVRSSENRAALWAAFLCSFCSLLRAQEDNLVETFDIESYDTERLREAADAGRPFLLSYFGDTHTLRVEPSQLRSERFTMTSVTRDGFRPMIPSRTRVYKGSVVGDPESIVRLMIDHRGLRGFIKSSEGWTFIEPVDKSGKVARAHGDSNVEHRVFGEQDLSDGNIGTCGGAHAQAGAQIEESSLVEDRMHIEEGTASPDAVTLAPPPRSEELQEDDPAPAEPGSLGMLGVAVVAEFEFFQIHGANALAEIEATINSVDGIYESAAKGREVRIK